jgi:hypothetical protein
MRAAPPLVFPSSRVLAGWWPQLAPLAPQSLTVGHLLLHHVEALVQSERVTALDALASLVLRALALSAPLSLADLEGRLHLGRQYLGRILGGLAAGGLAEVDAGGGWRVTAAGRRAAEGGQPRRHGYERRAFHFRDAPRPEFVPLRSPPCQPVAPPEGWRFDPGRLRACVAQPHEWKSRRGFPDDVCAVLTPESPEEAPDEPPTWQRVVVDRPEHLVLVLAVVPGDELCGLAVEPRGWVLQGPEPALRMGPGWVEAFPEAAAEPPPEAWRGAWRAWCQGHGVLPGEADGCALRRDGVLLRVGAPRELAGRLRAPNGEAWLLAGEGLMRTAARVELLA